MAYIEPALERSPAEMPGRFAVLTHAVFPVVAGSPAAMPKNRFGTVEIEANCDHVPTDCQLPPALN
jgi:hypothetical protein